MIEFIEREDLVKQLNDIAKDYIEDTSIQCSIAAGVVISIRDLILKHPTADVSDLINRQQAEIERLNNLKRFEKFICERIHTDKERNLTWDFATKEAEQEAFEQELEKLFDIATARVEIIKEIVNKIHCIITEIYNKYVFDGFDDLNSEEIDAIINFSDDVVIGFDNLVKEMEGDES